MRTAMFFERECDTQVRCGLCRFHCLIKEGARGRCGVRENRDGTLVSLVYGKLCAEHVDPIEKKPLYHVMPGSTTYSIATMGCNFHCRHCQNYSISQVAPHASISGVHRTPGQIVEQAKANGCDSISYTYTEPTVFYEFAYDTAGLARQAGLKNIFVTNGYISKAALANLAPVLDGANIDLKGFSEPFYKNVVQARLPEVLDSIVEYRKQGVWIELTTLIIPGLNDADTELQGIASFIMTHLGADTPWHVTAFYPTFLLTDRSFTPVTTLQRARDIGLAAGLHYVYEGNVPGAGGEQTRCPACSALLIERHGFTLLAYHIRKGACPKCHTRIAGVGL